MSLGVHGGLLLLIFVFADGGGAPEPHRVDLTAIEVVDPPPPPPPAPLPPAPMPVIRPAGAKSGALGRCGHEEAPRSEVRAPAVVDPFAELAVSYDRPSGPDPGNEAATMGSTLGAGIDGDGTGLGYGDRGAGYGVGDLAVPPAPPPLHSLARGPREKQAIHSWTYRGPEKFVGSEVLLELSIDPTGRVRNVRIVHGLEKFIDRRVSEIARHFDFYPALDAYGQPAWGLYRWVFQIDNERQDVMMHWGKR